MIIFELSLTTFEARWHFLRQLGQNWKLASACKLRISTQLSLPKSVKLTVQITVILNNQSPFILLQGQSSQGWVIAQGSGFAKRSNALLQGQDLSCLFVVVINRCCQRANSTKQIWSCKLMSKASIKTFTTKCLCWITFLNDSIQKILLFSFFCSKEYQFQKKTVISRNIVVFLESFSELKCVFFLSGSRIPDRLDNRVLDGVRRTSFRLSLGSLQTLDPLRRRRIRQRELQAGRPVSLFWLLRRNNSTCKTEKLNVKTNLNYF